MQTTKLYNKSFPILILAPALIIGGVVIVYPLLNGIILSFTNYTAFTPQYNWVGLNNYISIFKDPIYWEVVFNSIFIIFTSVFVQALAGLLIALLLNTNVYIRYLFRGFVFIIWIVPMIVISLLWLILFNSEYGIINYLLMQIGLAQDKILWLGKPWPARFALIIIYGWRGIPFYMVMTLAALQTIPEDIIEASTIDGVNALQRFFYIIFPLISPILFVSCLLSIVRLFQDITLIFMLTGGGPMYSTTTFAVHVYKEAFTSKLIGKAAAIGVTWLLFLFFLATFYIRKLTKKE